jgi:two-component system chemotaxis sensor kinase CheA
MTKETDSKDDGELDISQFLDDYYVECDEHLSVARRSVLALEPYVNQQRIDRTLLDELFRSFHSLKGLSAMVGLREAEQLAHHLESYLGRLRQGQAKLTTAGLEDLIAGITAIEQVVAAKRDHAPFPDVALLIKRLATSQSPAAAAAPSLPLPLGATSPKPAEVAAGKAALIAEKIASGLTIWIVRFRPTPAATERGVDVNSIRKQIQGFGELIHSEPQIESGGRIAFQFVLGCKTDERPDFDGDELVEVGRYEVPSALEHPAHIETIQTPLPAPAATIATAPIAGSAAGLSTHLVPANLVRVDLTRLDDLMRMVGELVLSRARLDDTLHRLNGSVAPAERRILEEINLAIEHQLRDLREGVMRVRMVPIHEVFSRMQFILRDLVREQDKHATMRLSGEDTQVDKFIVERLMDPLLHFVRNAVSHGLETPAERIAAGKSPDAVIRLGASTTGDTIVIEVEDDGRGIDAGAVMKRAVAMEIVAEQATLDSAAVLDILCTPGFSTREQVDRSSGRGVGMDVVRNVVEELGGTLGLDSKLGRGTRFIIRLPLTLAITDALIVAVAGQRYAVPQVSVREVIQIDPATIVTIEKNELLKYHNGVLPLLRLDRFFGRPSHSQTWYVLVVGEGDQAIGLVVERMLGLREIVVRSLIDRFVQVPGISGATELGDGQVVLIIDVANLVRRSRKQSSTRSVAAAMRPAPIQSVIARELK